MTEAETIAYLFFEAWVAWLRGNRYEADRCLHRATLLAGQWDYHLPRLSGRPWEACWFPPASRKP